MSITSLILRRLRYTQKSEVGMAANYKASCKCGYAKTVRVGGTRIMARSGTYNVAVLCRECGKLGSSIYGGDAPTCEYCKSTNIVSYEDSELRADKSEQFIELTSGRYFCPQCKEFGLRFEDSGMIFC
jgi:hypothetical protein